MIHIDKTEPIDPTWIAWRTKAKQETDDLIAGKKTGIDEDLYKEQRDLIYALFHGKCAYCETLLAPGQRYGDLDHYRPKGRVADKNGKLVFVNGKQHPGYFWLAYECWNLLPSCSACNRPGTSPDGMKSGKWFKFPVEGNYYAVSYKDDLQREQPLLLNPYEDDPDLHLEFDLKTGLVGPKTLRGEVTIDILGLNRDGLPEERLEVVTNVQDQYSIFIGAVVSRDTARADRYQRFINSYRDGTAKYAAMARAVIRDSDKALRMAGIIP